MQSRPLFPQTLSPELAAVGKTRFHFTALFEGPDGDAYIPRWDIRPELVSHDDIYGFVVQKVHRKWAWCPFVVVTAEPPIEVDSLRKWRGIKPREINHHHHDVVPDEHGVTGMEG